MEKRSPARYLAKAKWSGPKSFAWKDLSFEPISKDAAVVVGRFEWQTASGQTINSSYTGVLVGGPLLLWLTTALTCLAAVVVVLVAGPRHLSRTNARVAVAQ